MQATQTKTTKLVEVVEDLTPQSVQTHKVNIDGIDYVRKILPLNTTEEALRTFRKERLRLKELDHSGIPKLGECENSHFDREWIDGVSLRELIEGDYNLKDEEILKIGKDILEILDYVHSEGVIHRDIKPENIIYNKETNKVHVVDFGISKNALFSSKTTFHFAGTRTYMPSEQMNEGQSYKSTDLYAWGATMLELFNRGSITADKGLQNLKRERERVLKQLDPKIRKTIEQTLEYNHIDRQQSAQKVLDNIEEYETPNVKETTPTHKRLTRVMSGCILAAIAAGAIGYLFLEPTENETHELPETIEELDTNGDGRADTVRLLENGTIVNVPISNGKLDHSEKFVLLEDIINEYDSSVEFTKTETGETWRTGNIFNKWSAYDSLNNIVEEVGTEILEGTEIITKRKKYEYNSKGRISLITYRTGNNAVKYKEIHKYSKKGEIIEWYNGANTLSSRKTYNSEGEIVKEESFYEGKVSEKIEIKYDTKGRKISEKETEYKIKGKRNRDKTYRSRTDYAYDEEDRLILRDRRFNNNESRKTQEYIYKDGENDKKVMTERGIYDHSLKKHIENRVTHYTKIDGDWIQIDQQNN